MEDRSVIMGLSTLDNLRLGGGSVTRALELFPELQPLLHRRAGLLSGGEQQILTLARALAASPVALLADELSLGFGTAGRATPLDGRFKTPALTRIPFRLTASGGAPAARWSAQRGETTWRSTSARGRSRCDAGGPTLQVRSPANGVTYD